MKILHHNDADGRCAAALVGMELNTIYSNLKREDFIEYNYSSGITLPDVVKNEEVYIVDISLNNSTYEFLKYFLDNGCKVIYIDHHKSTGDFLKEAENDNQLQEYLRHNNLKIFYKSEINSGDETTKVSATMLTWIFSCMTDTEKQYPNSVNFDFSETFSHVALNIDDPNETREYFIPTPIRFIDDYDVWRKALNETDAFHEGYLLLSNEETHPYSDFWRNLIYDRPSLIFDIIKSGDICLEYRNVEYSRILKNAFVYDIEGHKTLCLNAVGVNSSVFGDKIHEYPMVCVYNYNGNTNMWKYSFYSSEKNPNSVDCSVVAKALDINGGGHIHAAGCQLVYNYFDDIINPTNITMNS